MASIIWNNLKGLKDKNEAFFGGAFCFALDWKFWRYRETQKYVIKAILNLAAKKLCAVKFDHFDTYFPG